MLGLIAGIVFGASALVGLAEWIYDDIKSNKRFENKSTPLDQFFFKAGGFSGEFPERISRETTESGYTCRYKFPAGVTLKTLEEKVKPAAELYLNASLTIEHKDDVIITVTERRLKPMYEYEYVKGEKLLEVCAGYDRYGEVMLDLEEAIHTLICGSTGSGKSVLLRSIITSLILKQTDNIILHLVDFQRCELTIFKNSRYVKTFCYTPAEFDNLLNELRLEANKRLAEFSKREVVNIRNYNRQAKSKMPYHVVIIDEFAVLAAGHNKEILDKLIILAGTVRKCGIHLILSTQRPTVDIVSGTLKNNIVTRIAFKMACGKDSEVVLDERGAENLNGKGHGLLKFGTVREFQGMFLDEDRAKELIAPTCVDKTPPKLEVIHNANVPRPQYTAFH